MIYNSSTKLEHLLEHEQAAAVLEGLLPGFVSRLSSNPQAMKLSIEQLIRYAKAPQAEVILEKLNAALAPLNAPGQGVTARETAQMRLFQELFWQDQNKDKTAGRLHTRDAIYPGRPWLDTKGERIQAHGGAVYYEDGVYYWYGENKEHTDGTNGIWTWGLKVYASKDLCNWEDLGFLIPPVLDDPNSPLFPTKKVDRPHILKCPWTGKYVCWIKISGSEAAFTIYQADRLLGPYTQVEALYQPGGYRAGDFDLVKDETTGKGYLYFDADHSSLMCMELTEDYLHAEKELARSYPNRNPPFTREGPALFEANGKKYLLTSGMTGYVPNKSDWAAADTWEEPFISMGNPHVADETNASFNSQISKVFKVEGLEGLYIAMADRWLPWYHVDERIADLFTRVIAGRYDPASYQATEAERREMYEANVLETANTSISDYVWLPVFIEKPTKEAPQGRISIVWRDCWRPEE